VSVPATGTERVVGLLEASGGVVGLSVVTATDGAQRIVECDLNDDVAYETIHQLRELEATERGPIAVDKRETAVIGTQRRAPDPRIKDREVAPVWEVVDAAIRANAVYPFSFYMLLICAGLLAAVGILTNSQILIVGAMVLGPEYGAILGAALGFTERRWQPARRASVALIVGFGAAVVACLVFALVVKVTVGAPRDYVLGFRPVSDLIDKPNLYSVIVAVLAGVAGVVSATLSRASALIGVFISVTTVPAAAQLGVACAFASWTQASGALEQLVLNVVILVVVGVVGLTLQRRYWTSQTNRMRADASPIGDEG
jgi:uncharacterized hydrophobic protein (TIGR00271 family)